MSSHIANYDPIPIDFVKGDGCFLFDKKGKKYLDFLGGWCVSTVGWKNPDMAAALARQAKTGVYVPPFFASARQEALAKRLLDLAPGKLRRVFRSTSGSEAVEYGIMCVRAATGKPTVVSIDGVYHGHTYGAAALGDACIPKIGPAPQGFIKLPLPKSVEGGMAVVTAFEKLIIERGDIAAFMSEPFWTNAGCHVPPAGFYEGIQKVCRRHGVLLAMDEVATGMGRSGTMFASELWGLTPDVICLGKSFTGGYASMGATLVTEELFRKGRGIPDYCTFGWLPQDLAAAEKNLDLIISKKLDENAADVGAFLLTELKPLERLAKVKQVRGQGLVFGIEFTLPIAPLIALACYRRGLVTALADARTLFFAPPLILDRRLAKQGAAILRAACGLKS
jgi:acetylornithine/succinyldiaminopimelate/putrescine aminotransferase